MTNKAAPTASMPEATAPCALKIWHLQSLFRALARDWELGYGLSRYWPGLYLYRQRLLGWRRLELRLQPDFLRDRREFYEFRFIEGWPEFLTLPARQDFACGRLDADQLLSEQRLRRELAEKASLLGLARAGLRQRRPGTTCKI